MENEEIKKIILQELPRLVEKDPNLREAVLQISREHFAPKGETRDRFDQLLEEIRQMRLESERKWAESQRRWDEQAKLWAENQRRWDDQAKLWAENQRRWDDQAKLWAENQRRWDDQAKQWAENQRRWDDQAKQWAENQRRWDDQAKQWAENQRRWDDQAKQWAENQRRWDEQERKWEENQQVIRKLIAAIDKVDQKGDIRLGAIGARWGIYTEQAFRNALQAMLKDFAGLEVVNVVEWDANGEVFGYPEEIELDLIIKNGMLILGEIKSSISMGEMYQFVRKARFYERLHNRKADRLIVISPMVEPKAREVAQKLGVEIYTHSTDAGEALSGL
jgi:hypothetical protein